MDIFEDEKMPNTNENDTILIMFTPKEYDYIKNLLFENYKLFCHFPKGKRTANFELFENIMKNKFEMR